MRFASGTALLVGAATAALALTGCSSSNKKAAAPATPIPAATIQASLLTPTDVGFTGGAYEIVPASTDTLPCADARTKPLNELVPAASRSGAVISSNALQAAIAEEVRVYKDQETANAALKIVEAGFDCATGQLAADSGPGEGLVIQNPEDILKQLTQEPALANADLRSAEVWHAATDTVQLAVIAVVQGRSLILFNYQTTFGSVDPKLETVADVIEKGMKKVVKT
jgi:hypothetical protein